MLYNTASYGRKIKYIEKRGSFMKTKKRNNKMMHNIQMKNCEMQEVM